MITLHLSRLECDLPGFKPDMVRQIVARRIRVLRLIDLALVINAFQKVMRWFALAPSLAIVVCLATVEALVPRLVEGF